jgi:hypothetical protein
MAIFHSTLIFGIVSTGAVLGCSSAPDEPTSRIGEQSSAAVVSTSVDALHILTPGRADSDIVQKAHEIVSSLYGSQSVADPVVVDRNATDEYADNPTPVRTNTVRLVDPGSPRTVVLYHSVSDSIDARNTGVTKTHEHNSSDVSEDQARKLAAGAFSALSFSRPQAGHGRIDFSEAVSHPVKSGVASSDGSFSDTWTDQYLFFAPVRLNGVVVRQGARDLGALIAVHRTGAISRIEIDAMGLASNEAGALAVGNARTAALAASDALAEASRAVPNAVVESVGLRYLFPVGGNGTPTVPRQVYRVHQNIVENGVVTGRSKAFTLSYAVDSATPVREVFPWPGTPSPPADTR